MVLVLRFSRKEPHRGSCRRAGSCWPGPAAAGPGNRSPRSRSGHRSSIRRP